jgi:hypothetical protein
MFEMLMNKDYLVIALMALAAFLLSYFNPAGLQNKRYKANGDQCPNASWHGLILLLIGTGLYVFFHKYKCLANTGGGY